MTGAEHTATRSPSVPVRGGLAAVLAVLANAVLVLGVDALGIAPAFRPLTIPPVAFLSALGAGGATVVYWLLDRYVSSADRTFVRLAAGVLLLSFVPDVALLAIDPAATPLAVVVLMAMHVVVAAVSVWVLVSWRAEQ
ncbi:DUF6069 family protein [Halorubrum rubrum]|uniref:DUF6069 family protein n=1 Tax=Halorubrum rubrum TaxID=1126240 RepID=A0ABD5R0T7_9EURY|nr:DUF6069 family protein [Halorubrum rubrum]